MRQYFLAIFSTAFDFVILSDLNYSFDNFIEILSTRFFNQLIGWFFDVPKYFNDNLKNMQIFYGRINSNKP